MKNYLKKDIILLLSLPFIKKVRVFHLILSIIAVMVVFTVIQGYMVLTYINSQQKDNQKMFYSAVQFRDVTDTLKSDLLYIRENYLKRLSKLSDSSSLDYTFNSIDKGLHSIEQIRNATSNTRTAEVISDPAKDLIETVKKLKTLAYAADTKEDFLECETTLFQALKDIGNIQTQVQESSYNTSTESKNTSRNQRNMAIIMLISATSIAVIIGILVNFSISWPIQEIIMMGRAMANGDFTHKINSFGCRESYEVEKEMNNSLNSLRFLIGNLNQEADQIAKASIDLKNTSKESGRSAEEVAVAMQELARAAYNQTDQVNQTANSVNDFGNIVKTVSEKTIEIANQSERVAMSAKNGQKLTNSVAQEINQIYLETQEIGKVIQELKSTTEKIEDITSVIREINDQTALLSLNAAIEAARAGEHGRGFAVVANDTGKLAERCRAAAETISDHTKEMTQRTQNVVNLMKQNISRVMGGKDLADQAAVTFEDIFNELNLVLTKINDVALSAKKMSIENGKITGDVSNIAAISEETMASTQEVSSSSEEQSAAAQEVTSLAENLLVISTEMKKAANVFKI